MALKEENEQHIFRSKLPDINIPTHLPLHTYCFQNLSSHRHRPYLINAATAQTFTHAEFELTSRRVAAGLHTLGIRKNDVVMLLLHNSPEFALAFLGASFLGAISTTANPLYTASEISLQAKISRPKLIITHACHAEKVRNCGTKITTIDPPPSPEILDFAEIMRSDENLLPPVEIQAEDTAALPFSSGTTGLPKGVMLSHRNLVACVSQTKSLRRGENRTERE